MKTKTLPATALFLLSVLALIFNACNKEDNCQNLAAIGQNPFLRISIVNRQNQSLLDPATQSHYDTAMVKKLNGDKVSFTKPGVTPVLLTINYTSFSGNQTFALSSTSQDNISISTKVNAQQCSISYTLQSVQYNGITLNATTDLFYIATNNSL